MANINKELENAVLKNNLQLVKQLLSRGADVNHCLIKHHYNTLLHQTKSARITKELLLCGAKVDAINSFGDTPLILANFKKTQIVKELLKHGADVNVKNLRGYTALNFAVMTSKNLDIIKLLLKYGADINIKTNECHCSPLRHAIQHLGKAKLLIKYTLMNNFDKDYKKVINLSPYKKDKNYSKISNFLDNCVSELIQMKSDKIRKGLSLYDILKNDFYIHPYQLAMKMNETDFSKRYPIYNDIILEKIPFVKKRSDLLKQLDNIEFYIKGKQFGKMSLDYDSTYSITQYLSNRDLINFIKAFGKSRKRAIESGNCIKGTDQTLNDTEASTSKNAKRIRLK